MTQLTDLHLSAVCVWCTIEQYGDKTKMVAMENDRNHAPSVSEPIDSFPTTQWSLVLAAGRYPSGTNSNSALATLCQKYWYPLYAYARRRVGNVDEAQDLTQAFFVDLLERKSIAVADPERGRFRAFLSTSFRYFLANQWDRARARKRGGDKSILSLDFAAGDSRYKMTPVDEQTPEKIFDRQWALQLLELVLSCLRQEYQNSGKDHQFDLLKRFITEKGSAAEYEAAGKELGCNSGAVQVAVSRLRSRYRGMLRNEIRQTVATEGEVADEIASLFNTFAK